MTVPVGLLYAIVPVLVASAIAFTAWIVRQLGRHAELLSKAATEMGNHDDRLKRLEGWQDGVQFGRSVERAVQQGNQS